MSADIVLRVRDLRPGDVVTPTRFRVSAVYPFGKVARIVGHYPGKDQRTKEWGSSTTVRVERPAPEPQIVPSKATLLGHGRPWTTDEKRALAAVETSRPPKD